MKSINVNVSVLILFCFLSFGCTQSQPKSKPEAEKQAIRELYDNRYYQGANDKDLELFMTSWSDDATRMEPDFFPIADDQTIIAKFGGRVVPAAPGGDFVKAAVDVGLGSAVDSAHHQRTTHGRRQPPFFKQQRVQATV